ncbi:MAG: VOC family protein [Fimbriimonadales bacterium]
MAKHDVCHIEWQSTDLSRSQAFFEGLFGWDFRSFGDTMVVFGTGEKHIGGLMKADRVEVGSSPSVWFDVDDIDAMCEKAVGLGGKVHAEKGPVPGVGFSAVVTDPDGNQVGLVQFA